MALIDVECTNGHITENYPRLAKDWQTLPACPECGAETIRIHLPPRTAWNVAPVTVFKGPDGTFRFPGDANGLSAKNYEKQGFERIEIRGAAEMRRFEKAMNQHEYSRASRRVEGMQRMREARERELRGHLRGRMTSMSRFGRDLARAAMRMNDNKPRERTKDPGAFSEVYSNDRSSREESRDAQGRRRRD